MTTPQYGVCSWCHQVVPLIAQGVGANRRNRSLLADGHFAPPGSPCLGACEPPARVYDPVYTDPTGAQSWASCDVARRILRGAWVGGLTCCNMTACLCRSDFAGEEFTLADADHTAEFWRAMDTIANETFYELQRKS